MDYITKPTSRKELRKFSKVFRFLFGVTDDNSPFPVLNALEILPDVFKGTTLSIVEDNDLLPNVPARCFPDEYGNFTIEKIKIKISFKHRTNREISKMSYISF